LIIGLLKRFVNNYVWDFRITGMENREIWLESENAAWYYIIENFFGGGL
jgi:hypothetical protein